MREISPDQLGEAVESILNSYKKEVIEASAQTVKDSADKCRDTIKNNVGKSGIKGTGAYRDSWHAEIESKSDTETVYRVYAKAPYYRLTHLLEHGHRKWVYGHDTGETAKAFAHIGPAVRDMKKQFAEKLKVKLSK